MARSRGHQSQSGPKSVRPSAVCPRLSGECAPSMETSNGGREEVSVMGAITELTFEECMQLLGAGQVGRAAFSTPMGPQIVPVNYVVCEGDIVFRTAPYSVLGTYAWDCDLAFEVDHIDEEAREGWSVVAVRKAHIIEDRDEVNDIRLTGDPRP
jgi:uncharacterized protein